VAVANWVTGELVAQMREAGLDDEPLSSPAEPDQVAALVEMVQAKQVSHGAAKTVLATMVAEGGGAQEIVDRLGLGSLSDESEIEAIVERAIETNAEAADQVRAGNEKAIGRIVGAAMKESKGRADGGTVTKLIREKLGLG
jgi:aspartyl-tRNA(Asn)/glutamyl-tRNA(Gln) amidotransferase subunit B